MMASRSDRRSAAASNMAVSVFGPSQNGKSFLVSVLARPEGRPLFTNYAGPEGERSYIRDINPEGEGESTGLVTRFTMQRPKTPEGFPVPLRLLALADLAQMLINSFYMDGDNSEAALSPEEIAAHVGRFESRIGAGSGGLGADDIWEMSDYVGRNFRSFAYSTALESFWESAARIAPRLATADLGAFLAPLWGAYPRFTELFDQLAAGLDALGHVSEVFAPMAALVPRDSSIIDVAQLHAIGRPDADTLDLALPGGGRATLPRPLICALTAELVLPMRDLPDPMFEQTDLLDFPGTRNRFSQPLRVTFEAQDGGLGQLILRGKVAYLFDRYVEDQKINAMLLCIKDSNMESIDLPKLVENWIALTQGASPEKRAQATSILFFCLTFFDKHLLDNAAGAGEKERFEKRLYHSLVEKFKPGGWVENWTPGQPFQNCFWVRNPNFHVEALFNYDHASDPAVETLRTDKRARLSELRAGYLQSPLVQTHFEDPGAAWDAALTENDGGIGHLRAQLGPVCNIDRKLDQIATQLDALREQLATELDPLHVSDDLQQRVEEKMELCDALLDSLEPTVQERSLGSFIATLMVEQDALYDRMVRPPAGVIINDASSATASEGLRAMRPRRAGSDAAASAASRPDAEAPARAAGRTMSRTEFLAETALRCWTERMDRLKADPRVAAEFHLMPELAARLAAELRHAAQRTGLEARIHEAVSGTGFGEVMEDFARPASIIAAEHINRFVGTLDQSRLPEAERARRPSRPGGPEVPLFATAPSRDDETGLPEEPRATLDEFWLDWSYALDACLQANARHVGGGDVDQERNGALGEILRALHLGRTNQREEAA